MQRTKIEWTHGPNGEPGYTWNPIKGICPVDCKTPDGKSYCYARRMYQRFDKSIFGKYGPEPRLDLDTLMVDFPKKPSRIFVCSTFELFHPLADPYRNNVFKHINISPEHTFIILTKMPERIDRPMPDNVWLGTTITQFDEYARKIPLAKAKARIKFLSIEPMLGPLPEVIYMGVDWLIVGRLTGYGHKYDPGRSWIDRIVGGCKEGRIPIFLKNNLQEIWGQKLIQEWPSGRD